MAGLSEHDSYLCRGLCLYDPGSYLSRGLCLSDTWSNARGPRDAHIPILVSDHREVRVKAAGIAHVTGNNQYTLEVLWEQASRTTMSHSHATHLTLGTGITHYNES